MPGLVNPCSRIDIDDVVEPMGVCFTDANTSAPLLRQDILFMYHFYYEYIAEHGPTACTCSQMTQWDDDSLLLAFLALLNVLNSLTRSPDSPDSTNPHAHARPTPTHFAVIVIRPMHGS